MNQNPVLRGILRHIAERTPGEVSLQEAPAPAPRQHRWMLSWLSTTPDASGDYPATSICQWCGERHPHMVTALEAAAFIQEMGNTPTPLPAATLWATWQRLVAQDPETAAAWYQTLSAADQATVSALTLAQVAAALGQAP